MSLGQNNFNGGIAYLVEIDNFEAKHHASAFIFGKFGLLMAAGPQLDDSQNLDSAFESVE